MTPHYDEEGHVRFDQSFGLLWFTLLLQAIAVGLLVWFFP